MELLGKRGSFKSPRFAGMVVLKFESRSWTLKNLPF